MSLPVPVDDFKPPKKVAPIVKQPRRRQISDEESDETDLHAIVEGCCKGVSVTVSLKNGILIWQQVGRKTSGVAAKLSSGLVKLDKQPATIRIPLCDVISVVADSLDEGLTNDDARLTIVARRPVDGAIQGRWCLWERTMAPLLSSFQVAKRWTGRANGALLHRCPQFFQRVGLLINSSTTTDWSINRVLLPILKRFNIDIDARIDASDAKQLATLAARSVTELSDLDSLLVVGGDGTVRLLCASLLSTRQKLPPLCILPSGRHSDIARSLMGGPKADFETALVHLLAGSTRKINCSRVLSGSAPGSLALPIGWFFNASLGLPTAALARLNRHLLFPDTKYDRALASVIAKPDFRPVSGTLRLQLAPASGGDPSDGQTCLPGCSVCKAESERQRSSTDDLVDCDASDASGWQCDFSDPVREFDPLDSSNCSSALSAQLSRARPSQSDATVDSAPIGEPVVESDGWLTISGEFLWIGVYSLSGRSGFCPGGLSPRCHANDGSLDVVLLRLPVSRLTDDEARKRLSKIAATEFAAALCGGSSWGSHLSLDYVSCYRCKTVRFQQSTEPQRQHTDGQHTENPIRSSTEDSIKLNETTTHGGSDRESTELRRRRQFQRSPSQLADVLCGDDDEIGDDGASSNGGGTTLSSDETAPSHTKLTPTAASAAHRDSSLTDEEESAKEQADLQLHQKTKKTKKSWHRRLAALKPAKLLQTTAGSSPRHSSSPAGGAHGKDKSAAFRSAEPALATATQDLRTEMSRWNFDYSEVELDDEVEFRCYPDALEIYCPAPGSAS
ncbi:hypothetical protein BOX15_Mlig012744g3 [Macrostomum lignano]|uniref:DAGKc domain-containing protein n=1 Tax=Macrostomum lignano TaxID=282301 RepID=A0A267GAM3_9PLAT|nr:hypothetical protein BOX15_Mlig012744g3 [Macrostomum lignano]